MKRVGTTIEEIAVLDPKLTPRFDASLDADHRRMLITLAVNGTDFVDERKRGNCREPNQVVKVLRRRERLVELDHAVKLAAYSNAAEVRWLAEKEPANRPWIDVDETGGDGLGMRTPHAMADGTNMGIT